MFHYPDDVLATHHKTAQQERAAVAAENAWRRATSHVRNTSTARRAAIAVAAAAALTVIGFGVIFGTGAQADPAAPSAPTSELGQPASSGGGGGQPSVTVR